MLMSKAAEKPSATRHDVFVERLAAVPEIARLDLGPLFRSTQAAELTESETEYVVQVKSSVENCFFQCCGAGAGAALFGWSRSQNNYTFSAPAPAPESLL